MVRFILALALMAALPARAASFCDFKTPAGVNVNLVQAFAAASKYYAQAPDVDMIFYGCRNEEVAVKDTTYGLLKKNGLPEERVPGVKFLFIFFTEFKDGAYQFSLDETDDPWMDGYATVNAMTSAVEPQYDYDASDIDPSIWNEDPSDGR